MTNLERLIHRGYFDQAADDGSDLPGDGRGDTLDGEDTKDVDGAGEDTSAGEEKDEGEDKGDEKPAKKPAGIMIPKERFDRAVEKARREAEAAIKRADEAEGRKRAGIKVQQRALAEQLGERAPQALVSIAHIRKATRGLVALENGSPQPSLLETDLLVLLGRALRQLWR
jgi:hypothetical protein